MPALTEPLFCGIYARMSEDPEESGEKVARQIADCRIVAEQRGWQVEEYIDNDLSAYQKRVKRPEWVRLVSDMADGRLAAVISSHTDRLYRRGVDLERLIDAVEAHRAEVVLLQTADLDLNTASGRMNARILAAVQQHESERNAERVARAKKARAAEGRPAGGGRRPFGLTDDRTALVVAEATELRDVAANILAGSTYNHEAARMNAAGVRTSSGSQWTIGTLQRVLTAPFVTGLRSYHGEIVGDAVWPPIIDRDTWEQLRLLAATRRRGRRPSDRYLLTGLMTCGLCGRRLYANAARNGRSEYRCSPALTTTGAGCGRLAIALPLAEGHVEAQVEGWLDDPVWREELHAFRRDGRKTAGAARVELDEIERRLIVLAEQWATGAMSDREHTAARQILEQRRGTALEALPTAPASTGRLTVRQIERAWRDGSTPQRRAWLEAMMRHPVVVEPGRRPAAQRMDVQPAWVD